MHILKQNGIWKIIIVTSLIIFLASSIIYKLFFFKIPEENKSISFLEWYENFKQKEISDTIFKQNSRLIESPCLLVDKIYKSMEGPMAVKEFFIENDNFKIISSAFSPKLLWITGYKVELFDDNDNRLSDDFMCHNNLNIVKNNVLPWKVNTLGTDTRLFTLTEGQVEINLPENYGIPILSNQRLRVDFQVLNHNLPKINLKVKQVVTIYYKYDSEGTNKMKALYQQSVFVTKQISGPAGNFNELPIFAQDSVKNKFKDEVKVCCTNTDLLLSKGYPFFDCYKREFTGHWTIDDSLEVITTDVSPMLNLEKDTKVHFFSVHVHPFCQSLELVDETVAKSIYKSDINNFTDRIGLKYISKKESLEGIQLFKNHKYTLTSVYNKTTTEKQTAMATMFLYCEEKK